MKIFQDNTFEYYEDLLKDLAPKLKENNKKLYKISELIDSYRAILKEAFSQDKETEENKIIAEYISSLCSDCKLNEDDRKELLK